MAQKHPEVVIVGAGPAGMMLAYQLASHGVQVSVLEHHPDLKREFQGELMQRSVIEQLERAGILRILLERGPLSPSWRRALLDR